MIRINCSKDNYKMFFDYLWICGYLAFSVSNIHFIYYYIEASEKEREETPH